MRTCPSTEPRPDPVALAMIEGMAYAEAAELLALAAMLGD